MLFTLFPDTNKDRQSRQKTIHQDFLSGALTFFAVTNNYYDDDEVSSSQNCNILFDVAVLFQNQLPKMPKEYIFRQVFDIKHKTIVLKFNESIVGAICYRPFYERSFVEIVFCAINSKSQIKGFGGFIMDVLKEHVKSEFHFNVVLKSNIKKKDQGVKKILGIDYETLKRNAIEYLQSSYKPRSHCVYLMTYADNFAIGYFKKNGFTSEITFRNWQGFIKDYDGGTIMQCQILWEVNYLKKEAFLTDIKQKVLARLSQDFVFNQEYPGLVSDKIKCITDIPGIRPEYLVDYMPERKTRNENISNILRILISELQSHTSAWPFLKPVKADEAPGYYNIIKNPMDLETMEKKIQSESYSSIQEFTADFKQMVENCCKYNGATSIYHKCAQNIDEFYDEKIKFYHFQST